MWLLLAQSIVALGIATLMAWLELVTSKYPRTFFLLMRSCWAIWVYPFIYGAIAFLATFAADQLGIQIQGLGPNSAWLHAVAIGFTAKALLHIRLFTVTVGSGTQPFPVGIESIVQIFEPWLLRTIELDEFNAVRTAIASTAAKYPVLANVKATINANVPPGLPPEVAAAFRLEVDRAADVPSALELYYRMFGKSTFNRVFP
jgi:hypothetical protein